MADLWIRAHQLGAFPIKEALAISTTTTPTLGAVSATTGQSVGVFLDWVGLEFVIPKTYSDNIISYVLETFMKIYLEKEEEVYLTVCRVYNEGERPPGVHTIPLPLYKDYELCWYPVVGQPLKVMDVEGFEVRPRDYPIERWEALIPNIARERAQEYFHGKEG